MLPIPGNANPHIQKTVLKYQNRAKALLLSDWISLIHGLKIKRKSLSFLQVSSYSYNILWHVGGL